MFCQIMKVGNMNNNTYNSTGKLLNFDTATNSSARMMVTTSASPESLLEILKENFRIEQQDKEKTEPPKNPKSSG